MPSVPGRRGEALARSLRQHICEVHSQSSTDCQRRHIRAQLLDEAEIRFVEGA